MKRFHPVLFFILCLFTACAGQQSRIIFHPDTNNTEEQTGPNELWQIIDSQSQPDRIPEWVTLFLDGEARGYESRKVESLDEWSGKYVFVGENRGDNFNALMQWAVNLTAAQDLPRLIAQRAERRLIAAASLYPDDEYGEFFASMIRKIFDGEYPDSVKEQTFWVKRKLIPDNNAPPETAAERYEFLVLISIDRNILQKQIRDIMAAVKAAVPATKEQTAAINKVQNTFFEGF